MLCVSSLLFLTGMFALSARSAVFYARDVLGNANLYICMTLRADRRHVR